MRKYQNYISWIAILLFTACQEKDVLRDEGESGNVAVRIEASIAGSIQTKANTESTGTQWIAEDNLAIRNTTQADYYTYVYRNHAWGPDGNNYLKWPDNEMTIVAYFPASATDGNFTLPTDQSDTLKLRSADFMSTATTVNGELVYADTLVSHTPESYSIDLTLYHRMTKVILNFTSKKRISNLKLNSSYAGFANNEPTGGITTIIPQERINSTTNGQTYTAIVVPDQDGQAEATFLDLEESGVSYTMKGIPAMKPGYEYTYSLMFNDEKKLSIAEVTVTPWKDMIALGEGSGHKVSYVKRGAWDPMMIKEGNTYYLVCSDAKITGYPYKNGIQMFTSTDLVNFTRVENGLTSSLENWGIAAFKQCAEKNGYEVADENAIYIGHPCLYKGSDGWYLLYTIQDETTPLCIMGYAYSPTLNNAQWTDKQSFLESVYHDKYRPVNPSIAKSGSEYMTLMVGDKGKFTYRWWQYRLGSVKNQSITRNTNREGSYMAGKALVNPLHTFAYGNRLQHFFIFSGYSICNASSHLDWRNNAPADYGGTSAAAPTNPATDGNVKVLTPYCINNGTVWYNTGGAHAFDDGNDNWFVVHHASPGSPTAEPIFHVRSMHWIEASVTGSKQAVPVICPEPYSEADRNPVAKDDLAGIWYLGNLKTINTAEGYNTINQKLELFADETASYNNKNYTWTYDEASHLLTLKLDVTLFMYVQGVTNYDSGKVTLAASGVTSDAKNSSYWMEKE